MRVKHVSELLINNILGKYAYVLVPTMRFICIYCHRILVKSNFAGFIRDSDNKGAEYHAWRHMTPKEKEIEANAEMLLQLC